MVILNLYFLAILLYRPYNLRKEDFKRDCLLTERNHPESEQRLILLGIAFNNIVRGTFLTFIVYEIETETRDYVICSFITITKLNEYLNQWDNFYRLLIYQYKNMRSFCV